MEIYAKKNIGVYLLGIWTKVSLFTLIVLDLGRTYPLCYSMLLKIIYVI